MEPSSASRSWAKSPSATSTDSSSRFASPSAEVPSPESSVPPERNESGTRGTGPREPFALAATPLSQELVDSLIEGTTDLPNRFFRYPAARALLPILGRIRGLTPNHVTYAHIVIGLVAAALVAFTHAKIWLFVAFALCEIRAILDCFDGVLARARGSSSPFGRALDEIADSIAFVALISAMTHRVALGATGLVVACATLAFGGLSANAWDFYKRKIATACREGRDGVLEELRHKRDLVESGRGTFLGWWGIYFDGFQILLYEVRPKTESPVTVLRQQAQRPALKRFVSLLSLLSFDNGLVILQLGVLTGLLFESQVLALGWAVVMWLLTMIAARVVLRGDSRDARVS